MIIPSIALYELMIAEANHKNKMVKMDIDFGFFLPDKDPIKKN